MKRIITVIISFVLVILVVIEVNSQSSKKEYMKRELNTIEQYLIHRDSMNKEVSKVAVAWHLDHSLKVINRIYDTLCVSKPEDYQGKFSITRILSLTFKYIPRGRANSPVSVRPPDTIKTKDIVSQLLEAREKVVMIESLDPKANFNHPVFGQLNKKQAKRFIEMHTHHHLKIIKDILEE